jgi:succinyl-CoA synthetase beta subunit
MRVLEWIASRQSLRAVLINIFAGITDLAEFSGLLATAMEQTPGLRAPVVARLVGRGAADARRILAERQPDMLVTEDLEAALGRIETILSPITPPPLAGGGRGRGSDCTAPSAQPPPARGGGV